MRLSEPSGTSKDYNEEAAKLYQSSSGAGIHRNFNTEESDAKELTDAWTEWGKE